MNKGAVWNSIQKVSQIRVHDPFRPASYLFPDLAQGVLRRSPSPISEAGIIEYRLEDGLQPIEQRLLAYPIVDRGYAQHSILARFVPLRDGVLPHRLRLIAILSQLPLQPIQLRVQLRLESCQIQPINTSPCPGSPSPSPRPSPSSSACPPCRLTNGPSSHPSG